MKYLILLTGLICLLNIPGYSQRRILVNGENNNPSSSERGTTAAKAQAKQTVGTAQQSVSDGQSQTDGGESSGKDVTQSESRNKEISKKRLPPPIPQQPKKQIQVNGKYGTDDLDDQDFASLKDLDVNAGATFLVNGGNGLEETSAPTAEELSADGKLTAQDQRNARNPKTNNQIAGNDVLNFANEEPGKSNKLVKTVITTTVTRGGYTRTVSAAAQSRGGRRLQPEYANYIVYYGKQYNVDPLLILEVMRQESSFNPIAGSGVGAKGLMQFMDGTGARFGITNPYDPQQSIRAGAAYLSFLLNRYGGNIFSTLAAYNAGEGAVDCFLTGRTLRLKNGKVINGRGIRTQHGIPPYAETQDYVRKISSKYFAHKNRGA